MNILLLGRIGFCGQSIVVTPTQELSRALAGSFAGKSRVERIDRIVLVDQNGTERDSASVEPDDWHVYANRAVVIKINDRMSIYPRLKASESYDVSQLRLKAGDKTYFQGTATCSVKKDEMVFFDVAIESIVMLDPNEAPVSMGDYEVKIPQGRGLDYTSLVHDAISRVVFGGEPVGFNRVLVRDTTLNYYDARVDVKHTGNTVVVDGYLTPERWIPVDLCAFMVGTSRSAVRMTFERPLLLNPYITYLFRLVVGFVP